MLFDGIDSLLATTKLKSHWVAAAIPTFKDLRRALGISDTIIQQHGPQPTSKKLVHD